MKLLDTHQVAQRLKVSVRRVQALCRDGRLGRWIGRQWVIPAEDLRRFKHMRPGRPPKKRR